MIWINQKKSSKLFWMKLSFFCLLVCLFWLRRVSNRRKVRLMTNMAFMLIWNLGHRCVEGLHHSPYTLSRQDKLEIYWKPFLWVESRLALYLKPHNANWWCIVGCLCQIELNIAVCIGVRVCAIMADTAADDADGGDGGVCVCVCQTMDLMLEVCVCVP